MKMSLSKTNFVNVAQILKTSKTKKDVACSLINYFKQDNPQFDEERFRKAAGLKTSCRGQW
jgi:hypothetical protein